MKNVRSLAVALLMAGWSLMMHAQPSESDTCRLKVYQSGDLITIDGKVFSTPDGVFLQIPGCEHSVVVAFPSDLKEKEKSGLSLSQNDQNFQELNADLQKRSTKEVKVTLSGRLDVAKPIPEGARVQLGIVFDASGKVIGPYGFGQPLAAYKYRLVLQQVASKEVIPAKH